MQRKTLYESTYGVTLVELVVAVAILTVLLLGLFASLTTSLATSENSKINAVQQKIAQMLMEELLSRPYDQLINNTKYYLPSDQDTHGMDVEATVHEFLPDIKQITVRVTIPGKEDRPPFTISTLKGRNSL